MSCKFLKTISQDLPILGGKKLTHKRFMCQLKIQSESKKLEVYGKLAELGLENSFVNEECPVAAESNFGKCPYYVKGN